MSTPTPLHVVGLGMRPYLAVLDFQRALVRARLNREVSADLLLLVEHPPVVTLGRGTRSASLPISTEALRARGFDVVEVERGGDVTVHAPGQVVGYPILDLTTHRKDLHWYLRTLEQALIDGLDQVGLSSRRREGLTGVWIEDRKIASIGVHVKQWVTMHGFALNVSTDLSVFDVVVPCGIPDVTMTSVMAERGSATEDLRPETVIATLIGSFAHAFQRTPVEVSLGALPVSLGEEPA